MSNDGDGIVVLVCGGRNFSDYSEVCRVLNDVHEERSIGFMIHGAARGADSLADRWAGANNIPRIRCHANWERDGKAAGPLRNARMLEKYRPDLVIAFAGGKGTAHMMQIARKANVEVREIPPRSTTEMPAVRTLTGNP